jgi:hypothetical protein
MDATENFADIKRTSQLYKGKRINALRTETSVNIHKISGSNKTLHPLTPFFLFFSFFLFNKKNKQQTCFHNKEDSIDQACKVETNLTSGRGLKVTR